MPGTFQCSVVTPEKEVFEGAVTQVVVPAHDGEMGFLVNRAPILVQVGEGRLKITPENGGSRQLAVAGGFAQMKDNQLTVLTDKAEDPAAAE
jgi:F-type H+-transporting ATPase subunit epsilon